MPSLEFRCQMHASSPQSHNGFAPAVLSPRVNPSEEDKDAEDDDEEEEAGSRMHTCCITELRTSEEPAKLRPRGAARILLPAVSRSSSPADNNNFPTEGKFHKFSFARGPPVFGDEHLSPSAVFRRRVSDPCGGGRRRSSLRFLGLPVRLPTALVSFFFLFLSSSLFYPHDGCVYPPPHLSVVPSSRSTAFSDSVSWSLFPLCRGAASFFPSWTAEAVYISPSRGSVRDSRPGVLPPEPPSRGFSDLFFASASSSPAAGTRRVRPRQSPQSLCPPSRCSSGSLRRGLAPRHVARDLSYLASSLPSRKASPPPALASGSQRRDGERAASSVLGFLRSRPCTRGRCLLSAVDSRGASSFLGSQEASPVEAYGRQRKAGNPFGCRPDRGSALSSLSSDDFSSVSTHDASEQRACSSSSSSSLPQYCLSVSATQRLPTRTVVIGRGAEAAAYHDFYFPSSASLSPPSSVIPPGSWREGFPVLLGGSHPLVLQTMVNSDTRDVGATVEQVRRISSLPRSGH